MAIKFIQFDFVGEVGVNPRLGRILCTENLSQVTAAGFLNPVTLMGNVIYPTDFIFIAYNNGTSGAIFRPSIASNGVITLSLQNSSVKLPVVNGDFAIFDGTSGEIKDAGYSPTTDESTKVIMFYDEGSTLNNIPEFADPNGSIKDSGVGIADVQLKANIKAATTADIGGAGAGPITVALTGLTATSVVVATVESSTNPVSVVACTAGTNEFDITFSADPGAACLVNYIAFIAAQ
jgi:hypothetical protein